VKSKLLVLAGVVLLVGAFFAFGGHRYLTFEALKAQQAAIQSYYADHPWQTVAGFFLTYVVATALSFPGAATVLTLAAGAVFGLVWGTVIVSFASSIGATLAYLASRFLFRDWVQQKFGQHLRTINEGVEKEGGFYLFTLRLIPAVPFFVINLAMGLTPIRAWTFYWVSQLGMLAGTIVYVNAGNAAGGDFVPRRDSLARPDRRVRAARHLPADRQEDRRRGQGAARVCALEGTRSRRATTATWW
jgi:uncharacterized membrane protein YdjX (TVP38/TMEM64 family)